MYFGFDGGVRACCINKNDRFGYIQGNNISQLWKSGSMEPLRNHIRNYNLSGGCNYCEQQLKSKNYKAFEGRIYDSVLPVKNSDFPLEMTFELSNTCNLECIMCNGTYSSSIRKNRDGLPPLPEVYDEHFIDSIKAALNQLKVVRLIGGEPFLIPQYYEIIEYLIEHNPACRIYIQTNGSVLNNRVKRIIENSNIHLSISIDSLKKDTYEFIRKNASFERLMEHMEYFRMRAQKYNQSININFCVLKMNWDEVPAIVSYCNRNNFTLTLIPVQSPKHLSLDALELEELYRIAGYYTGSAYDQGKDRIKNQLNSGRLNDLMHSLNYLIHEKETAQSELHALLEKSSDALKAELTGMFDPAIFESSDISAVGERLSEYTMGLPELEQRQFLSTCISHIRQEYARIALDYFGGKEWVSKFDNYFLKSRVADYSRL
jgi:molybdenum cofactor biosynthesis enzyme MoaA